MLVVTFKGVETAAEVLRALRGLAADHLIALEDACIAVRGEDGRVHLTQAIGDRLAAAVPRHFWSGMVAHILHHGQPHQPAEGVTPGLELDRGFVRRTAESLEPGTSALLVVVRGDGVERVVESLKPFDGTILHAPLPPAAAPVAPPSAAELRALVNREHVEADRERASDQEHKDQARQALIRQLTEAPWTVSDERAVLHQCTEAARHGAVKVLAYRFPSDLCSDGGRAINSNEADWPATLVGQPRLVFEFWRDTLRSLGYRLTAEVLDFPGGMPGDVGFTLIWGGEQGE